MRQMHIPSQESKVPDGSLDVVFRIVRIKDLHVFCGRFPDLHESYGIAP